MDYALAVEPLLKTPCKNFPDDETLLIWQWDINSQNISSTIQDS